jgi:hypothetical protein
MKLHKTILDTRYSVIVKVSTCLLLILLPLSQVFSCSRQINERVMKYDTAIKALISWIWIVCSANKAITNSVIVRVSTCLLRIICNIACYLESTAARDGLTNVSENSRQQYRFVFLQSGLYVQKQDDNQPIYIQATANVLCLLLCEYTSFLYTWRWWWCMLIIILPVVGSTVGAPQMSLQTISLNPSLSSAMCLRRIP